MARNGVAAARESLPRVLPFGGQVRLRTRPQTRDLAPYTKDGT
jgi:hypothetical protein